MLEVFQAELAEAGPDAAAGFNRLALTLNKASREELQDRVLAILDEFVTGPPTRTASPRPVFAMHRRPRTVRSRPGERRGRARSQATVIGEQLVHQEQSEVGEREGHQQ